MATDEDDFSDLDFDDTDVLDEFADLAEFDEPEADPNAIDLSKPLCATCGHGQAIPGPTKRSRCQKCDKGWAHDQVEEAPAPKQKKDGPPRPILSGHCGYPQTKNPHESHRRCAQWGAGSRANPEKRFHPCPCPCHLQHERISGADPDLMNPDGTYGQVEMYDCGGCGGLLAPAPVFGTDEDGDPVYVHVNDKGRMLYTGPCQ